MDEVLENNLDSDALLVMVLFGGKKAYSRAAGAFLCGIQEGAFQLIKGSIMIMQHFVWLMHSLQPANRMPLMVLVECRKPCLCKPVLLGTFTIPITHGLSRF